MISSALMAEPPNIHLTLSNRPENVLLVRQALGGIAQATALDGLALNDISTAVTEACNNVVLHAYKGEEGPMAVDVCTSPDTIDVIVRDRGHGLPDAIAARTSLGIEPATEHATETPSGSGLGLPVIHALAQHVELSGDAGEGTTVRMRFAAPQIQPIKTLGAKRFELPPLGPTELASTTWVTIDPPSLARPVLPRLLSVLAARAHFSTDRISDTTLLTDALLAETPNLIDHSQLGVAISVQPGDLELRIGPLRSNGSTLRVIDLPTKDGSTIEGLNPIIERLSTHRAMTPLGSAEMLKLRLNDVR